MWRGGSAHPGPVSTANRPAPWPASRSPDCSAWRPALWPVVHAGRPGSAASVPAHVTGVLATRGAFGMAGRTDLLASGASSERFRSMDRRVYSPVCLTLAALSLPPQS